MASAGISEFSFGFAFLHEQTVRNWTQLVAAPVLPSLRREADEGWDARLPTRGIDFYYQFKLSDCLERSNAKFIRDGSYNDPYYRISLYRRNNSAQHNRLIYHSNRNTHTYYVAPEVRTEEEFNRTFLSSRVMDNSRLIPLARCRRITDSEQHYITFQPGDSSWMQHSEPTRRKDSVRGEEVEKLYRESSKKWQKIDEEFAVGVYSRAAEIFEEEHVTRLTELRSELTQMDLLTATQQLLSPIGLHLVIVGSRE